MQVSFADGVKFKTMHADVVPSMKEASMMCTIAGQSLYKFTKNTWIGILGALCHSTNNDAELYCLTDINELIQVRSRVCLL